MYKQQRERKAGRRVKVVLCVGNDIPKETQHIVIHKPHFRNAVPPFYESIKLWLQRTFLWQDAVPHVAHGRGQRCTRPRATLHTGVDNVAHGRGQPTRLLSVSAACLLKTGRWQRDAFDKGEGNRGGRNKKTDERPAWAMCQQAVRPAQPYEA